MRMNMGELAQAKRKKQPAAERGPAGQPASKKQKVAAGASSAAARVPPSRAPAPPGRAPTSPSRPARASDDEVEIVPPPALAIVPTSIMAPTPPTPSDQATAWERKGKAPATSAAEPKKRLTHIEADVPVGASALKNREVAEDLLKLVLLPKDVELRRDKALDDLVMSFFPGLIKMTLDISLIQEGIQQYADLVKRLQNQAETAKADLEVSEERRLAGEAREARFQEERRKLAEERNKSVAEVRNKAAEEKNMFLGKVRSLEDQLKEQREKLTSEREWASQMEIQVAKSGDRITELEGEVGALRHDIDSAGHHAVEAYKSSPDFAAEVAEGCLDSFHLGFLQCRRMVTEQFPGLDVSKLVEPEDLSDLPDVEEEAVEKEPTLAEAGAEEVVPDPDVPREQGTVATSSSELISTVAAEIIAMVTAGEARAPEE